MQASLMQNALSFHLALVRLKQFLWPLEINNVTKQAGNCMRPYQSHRKGTLCHQMEERHTCSPDGIKGSLPPRVLAQVASGSDHPARLGSWKLDHVIPATRAGAELRNDASLLRGGLSRDQTLLMMEAPDLPDVHRGQMLEPKCQAQGTIVCWPPPCLWINVSGGSAKSQGALLPSHLQKTDLSFPKLTRRGWPVATWDFPAPHKGFQIRWVRRQRRQWRYAGVRGRKEDAHRSGLVGHTCGLRARQCAWSEPRGPGVGLTPPTQALQEPHKGGAPCRKGPLVTTPSIVHVPSSPVVLTQPPWEEKTAELASSSPPDPVFLFWAELHPL
ncbi:hypothetical protein CB1_000159011 [Camelus ferus]|nr:hypothetical protein CB1_000159011 [Camelus ferus]